VAAVFWDTDWREVDVDEDKLKKNVFMMGRLESLNVSVNRGE
jgi:hypothetical protein